jgi:hypothetical protein
MARTVGQSGTAFDYSWVITPAPQRQHQRVSPKKRNSSENSIGESERRTTAGLGDIWTRRLSTLRPWACPSSNWSRLMGCGWILNKWIYSMGRRCWISTRTCLRSTCGLQSTLAGLPEKSLRPIEPGQTTGSPGDCGRQVKYDYFWDIVRTMRLSAQLMFGTVWMNDHLPLNPETPNVRSFRDTDRAW